VRWLRKLASVRTPGVPRALGLFPKAHRPNGSGAHALRECMPVPRSQAGRGGIFLARKAANFERIKVGKEIE
jgi:hypothetical protein